MITQTHLAELSAHAQNECPFEACGILIPGGIVRCENLARDRYNHFSIGNFELHRVARHNKVLGIYHSHVNQDPVPSDKDFEGAESFAHYGWWYLIATVSTKNGGYVNQVQPYILRRGRDGAKEFAAMTLGDGKPEILHIIRQHA